MKLLKLISVFICLIIPLGAFAKDIKVGVINLKPWGSVLADRTIAGQHIDFFNELSKRTGLSFDYKIMSIPNIKTRITTGDIDMTVIFRREDMMEYVNFLGLVLPYNYYLVGKQGETFDEAKIRELKTVGYIEGEEDVAKSCFSTQFNPTAKMLPAPNYGDLLRMVNGGRFEAATIPSKGLKAYLGEIGVDETYVSKLFILCKNEAYLQVSKKSSTLTQKDVWKLRQALIAMREDGTVHKIADKYSQLQN